MAATGRILGGVVLQVPQEDVARAAHVAVGRHPARRADERLAFECRAHVTARPRRELLGDDHDFLALRDRLLLEPAAEPVVPPRPHVSSRRAAFALMVRPSRFTMSTPCLSS